MNGDLCLQSAKQKTCVKYRHNRQTAICVINGPEVPKASARGPCSEGRRRDQSDQSSASIKLQENVFQIVMVRKWHFEIHTGNTVDSS